jgi:hypothetical protein
VRLARDGYLVVITQPASGASTASYNLAARSGVDFLLSPANPHLAEADTNRIGAAGWSLGGRSLTRTQEEDERLDAIVAWDNLALSETGDEGSPLGDNVPNPVRRPRVPALGQASELGRPGAQAKLTAFQHWRSNGVPCAQISFNTGMGFQAHLRWGSSGTEQQHDEFHHYTRAWFDRWLKDDSGAVARLLTNVVRGTPVAGLLSTNFLSGLFLDGVDTADLRGAILAAEPPPALVPRTFRPSATDPAITAFDNFHFAYFDPAARARGRLLVFLPGTGGSPFFYRLFLQTAARLGFHALGLMYVNPTPVNELCGAADDCDCAEAVRLEIIEGTDRSPKVAVDRANSIENRLLKALLYLDAEAPEENWGQYLGAGTNILWPRIVIAGHSQGGGHAGLLAKTRVVSRCLMFAGLDWCDAAARPADWAYTPGLTPVQRYRGFGHLRDPLIQAVPLRAMWRALGLPAQGAEVLVEEASPPFGYSHQWMTDLEPPAPGSLQAYHGVMVVDPHTPLAADGSPRLRPAWEALLTAPDQPVAVAIQSTPDGGLRLSFPAGDGLLHQLQSSDNLAGWQDEGTAWVGQGGATNTVLPRPAAAKFWRLLIR